MLTLIYKFWMLLATTFPPACPFGLHSPLCSLELESHVAFPFLTQPSALTAVSIRAQTDTSGKLGHTHHGHTSLILIAIIFPREPFCRLVSLSSVKKAIASVCLGIQLVFETYLSTRCMLAPCPVLHTLLWVLGYNTESK